MVANTRYTVGNGNGGKNRTIAESTFAHTRHTVGDGHSGNTRTATVFASRFISTTCVLNGRKVMTQIL